MKRKIFSAFTFAIMLVFTICPMQAFATTNGFVSDTTNDFSVSKGNNYTFKITTDSNDLTFTSGNSNVIRVINEKTNGNDKFFTINAAGSVGECAGIYVSVNGVESKLCNVTVGYRVGTTGKHLDTITDDSGRKIQVINQDKGWQLQIEERPIHYTVLDEDNEVVEQEITLQAYLSEVNEAEKYFVVAFGGGFDEDKFYDSGLKLTTASGEELAYEPYGFCKFKVSYDNIEDIQTMYFGTDTEKATLKMIHFE
jgi:hypothetical protein